MMIWNSRQTKVQDNNLMLTVIDDFVFDLGLAHLAGTGVVPLRIATEKTVVVFETL